MQTSNPDPALTSNLDPAPDLIKLAISLRQSGRGWKSIIRELEKIKGSKLEFSETKVIMDYARSQSKTWRLKHDIRIK